MKKYTYFYKPLEFTIIINMWWTNKRKRYVGTTGYLVITNLLWTTDGWFHGCVDRS